MAHKLITTRRHRALAPLGPLSTPVTPPLTRIDPPGAGAGQRARSGAQLLPLGALAAGFGWATLAVAQTAATAPDVAAAAPPAPTAAVIPAAEAGLALRKITVKGTREPERGKDSLQATTTTIGKGRQELRDVPQSVTVVTEKLMDDRNLDTMKEALKNTAGITFQAAEGGEEDIRLRGFPLASTGDIFVDGMRDPAFYDRDTFFLDRLEVLRGSASMLFGRGSTGGAVNQVTKAPLLRDESQVDLTGGSHDHVRVVGDFNIRTGDSAALRLGAMKTQADNSGAGSSLDKSGLAATYRWGIGAKDEFSAGVYHLDNNNGINYGMPWVRPTATAAVSATTLVPLDPSAYYGLASDYNRGTATTATLSHIHRFDANKRLSTQFRVGQYTRDQRASTIRFAAAAAQPDRQVASLANFGASTVLTRGTQNKIQDMDNVLAQSDFSGTFNAFGTRHEILAGADAALEKKTVYAARSAAQGGVDLIKPTTTVGAGAGSAAVDESARVLRTASRYVSKGVGVYAQDLVEIVPMWKLLAGLRYDQLHGSYDTVSIPTTAAGPESVASYTMKVSEWSKRLGLMFQPNAFQSYHASAATSFNTSGDAYALGAANADIPPEQSINMEVGGRIDSQDGRFSTRFAVFRSTKLHERNTDPLVDLVTLSGKRHVAGAEVDFAGRLSAQWEVYGSYMWMPVAKIDIGVAGSEGQGTRPSLTPRHSGTVWSTYKLSPQWRVGAGLNARSGQQPTRNPGWYAPKFMVADAMAEYTVNQNFLLKANVSNLTNKLYADQLYTGHYVPGPGRLVQVTASVKF